MNKIFNLSLYTKSFLHLGDICKFVQFRSNSKFLWNVKRPNQAHCEMTPFVIFNAKKLKLVNTINEPMKQPNNITVISKKGICQLNNFGMLEVL